VTATSLANTGRIQSQGCRRIEVSVLFNLVNNTKYERHFSRILFLFAFVAFVAIVSA
jgi:hypothetical protein